MKSYIYISTTKMYLIYTYIHTYIHIFYNQVLYNLLDMVLSCNGVALSAWLQGNRDCVFTQTINGNIESL